MATNPYGWTSQPTQNQQGQMDAFNRDALAQQQDILRTQGREAASAFTRRMGAQQQNFGNQLQGGGQPGTGRGTWVQSMASNSVPQWMPERGQPQGVTDRAQRPSSGYSDRMLRPRDYPQPGQQQNSFGSTRPGAQPGQYRPQGSSGGNPYQQYNRGPVAPAPGIGPQNIPSVGQQNIPPGGGYGGMFGTGQTSFNANQFMQQAPQFNYGGGQGGFGGGQFSPQQNIPEYLQSPNQQGMPPGGGQPGGGQQGGFQFNSPQSSFQGNPFSPIQNYGAFGSQDERMKANSYSDNFLQPYLNYDLQKGDQAFNQQYGQWNANEQFRLNNFNMGLQGANTNLNYAAFNAGLGQAQAGLEQNQFGLDTNRLNVNNQFTLGQGGLANERFGLENQFTLGQGNLAATNKQIDNQYSLGQGGLANERFGLENQFTLGNAANANQATSIANQFTLGQGNLAATNQQIANQYTLGQGGLQNERFANQTGRLGVENQFALGNRGLNLQEQQQGFQQGYQNRALQQEADLMRERYQNDLTQSRYSAFGRAQAPNFRQMNSWR